MSDKKISNANTPSRLFAKDESFIKGKVRNLGSTDSRFKDNSSAVRYYVSVGIAAERRLDAANSLDDKIIKASQREVVSETLLPIKNSIDDLITVMQQFGEKQIQFFTESGKQSEIIIRRVETLNELLTSQVIELLKGIFKTGKLTTEAFRNTIVLRSILYVFLLAYKTGKLEPKQNLNWEEIITAAHTKAQALSVEEISMLEMGKLETNVVRTMAQELFTHINRLNKSTPGT